MYFLTTSLFTILLTILSVHAVPNQYHKRSHGYLSPPVVVPLKHVTRAELIERATRPKERVRKIRGQVVIRPYPKSTCKDFTSTGLVPYARWTNLDQHGVREGVLTVGVENRDVCVQMCENNLECVSVTYDLATMNCHQITDTGLSSSDLYFHGDADVTNKDKSCDDLSAISTEHPDASCCTEYRSAISA